MFLAAKSQACTTARRREFLKRRIGFPHDVGEGRIVDSRSGTEFHEEAILGGPALWSGVRDGDFHLDALRQLAAHTSDLIIEPAHHLPDGSAGIQNDAHRDRRLAVEESESP